MAALKYKDVKELYDELRGAGVTTASMPEWAGRMNTATKSNMFSEGLHDNFVKQLSNKLDVGLEHFLGADPDPTATNISGSLFHALGVPQEGYNLPELAGHSVESLFNTLGFSPEVTAKAKSVGEGLPRTTVNVLPMLVSGGVGGLLTMAGLSGAETYTATDSPAAGITSAAVAGLMPGAANLAEQQVLKRIGGKLVEGPIADAIGNVVQNFKRYFPTTKTQGVTSLLAGQGAAATLGEAGKVATSVVDPSQKYEFSPTEVLLNMTLGQLPFAGSYLGREGMAKFGGVTTEHLIRNIQADIEQSRKSIALKTANDALQTKSSIEKIPTVEQPEVIDPKVLAEQSSLLAQLRGEQIKVKDDPSLTDEQKVERTNSLLQQESQVLRARESLPTDPTSVFGDSIKEDSARQQVVGRTLKETERGRAVFVEDMPVNPEGLRGKVVWYSKAYEPEPTKRSDGTTVFGLPDVQWRTTRTMDEWNSRFPKKSDGTLELPVGPEVEPSQAYLPKEEIVARLADLDRVRNDVQEAQTTGDLHQAVTRLQSVQDEASLSTTTDVELKKTAKQLTESGLTDPSDVAKAAVSVEAAKTARRISTRDQERAVAPLSPEQAADVTAMLGQGGFQIKTLDKLSHTNEVAGDDSPETQPHHDLVTETAIRVTESDDGKKAFQGWISPEKVNTSLSQDQQMFQSLTDEFGTLADVDVSEAADYLATKLGIPPAETKDQIKDFLSRPHVQVWELQLENELRRLRDGNAAPRPEVPAGQGWKVRSLFIPEPEDVSRIADLGIAKGGEGLRRFLLRSSDPFYRALGLDLEKFGPSLARVTAKIEEIGLGGSAHNLGNGQVEVKFSPGILNAANADYYVAHELVHGLTLAELDNPTKAHIVEQLTDLRNRLIDKLPADMRKAYDKAVAEDWYNKFARAEVDFKSLHKDPSKGLVIYGLLTNQEMVAQGLTEPQMRVFMQGVKSEGGQGWFSRFTNIVKRLVGLGDHVPDSAFEEFLSKTDALLQHGNYVNDFMNYSNRYFENLGYSQGLVNAQTRRALGIVLDSVNGTTPESIFATLQQSPIIRSTELIRANRDVIQMLNEKGEDFQNFSSVMDELGHNVDMRGLNDFTYEALVNGENHDAIDLLPDAAAKYIFAQAKDMADVVGVLKAATSEKNQGLINLTDAKGLRLPTNEAQKKLDAILSVSKMHDLAVQQIQGLYAVTPDGYFDKLTSPGVRAPEWVEEADKTKGKVSWIKNFLQPTGQWAREDPRAGEIVAKGHQLASNSRKMASEGLKVFGLDADQLEKGGNVLSKDAVNRMEKVLKQPKLVKAVNDWMFLNQKAGQADGETYIRPEADPEVAKVLQGLTQDEKSQVHDLIAKQQISMQMMHAQQLEKMLQIAASDGAVLVGNDSGLKAPQNVQLAQSLLEASVVDRTNPLEVQAYTQAHGTDMDTQVALVQQRLQPEVFNRLLRYTVNEVQKYNAWKEFFGKNPAWASGQRYGKFLLEYRRGNRTFLAGVESRKEAESLAEGGKITKFEPNRKYDEDSPPNLGPDAVGMITRLRELEQNRIDMLKNVLTPEQIEQLQKTSPVEQLATEEAYRGGVPGLRPPARGLTKGAEELPWLSNHFSWVQKTASYWSRQLLRAQSRAYLLDPEIVADPELQKRAKTHVDNILANDPELVAKFNKFTTTWFMGYNPASALINATQSFVTHVSELTSMTGKPIDSYRRVLDAMSELRGAKVGRLGFRGDEHDRLMTDAAKDGEIDYSMFDTDASAQESIATNYKRILNGQRMQTVGQYIGTAAGAYTKAGMWMFRGVEKLNNQIALLASYDYYREQGLDYQDAKTRAYEFNRSVNYGGGRAQRPVGAFSGRGAFARGVAVTMTALQNYNLGTTFQIARYIQRGFFRPEGVTPAERYNARIATTQMLATQLFAAGTLGLPFVSGAIALLDKAFPDLEVNKNIRTWVDKLFGNDKENGSVLTDIAMTGVPSMFGWDLQSRLSMGNTVPGVSEVNGFQPELLAGPPANLIGSFVRGGLKLAQGDLTGLQSFLPSALKKVTQVATSGGVVKDYRDRPIFQPTVGETLGLSLGFQPKRLSDYNAAARIADNSQTAMNRSVGQERQSLAEEVLKGNFGTVRQTLLAKGQDDKNYNPLEEVRAIARAAEDLTFPRDLRREGSKAVAPERKKLLRAFNLPPTSVSEIDRLKFRLAIQQRLGLPGVSKGELVRAQVIDQLRQSNPNATRAELSRQADLMLRGAGQSLQEPSE